MRIAYLTSQYARASDTFIRNEVIGLRAKGHVVHTFSIRREPRDQEISAEIATEQSTTDYILEKSLRILFLIFFKNLVRYPLRMSQSLKLAWQIHVPGLQGLLLQCAYLVEASYLADRLMRLNIEVLHNHIAENSANVAMYASMISGIPFSMTVHGPYIFYHPEQAALGEKIARSVFTATITNFCKSQCMLFTDRTAWNKIHIIRCAVGKTFEGAQVTPIPIAPRLVFVGRLCAEKGLTILIEAFARHIESGAVAELVLIGDGPLRSEIETIIQQRKLTDAIKLLGWKSSQEVREEIEKSRALVLPSFAEGLPVVIMEAFALGRPVISTYIAGIPELVIHNVNGCLVPAGSVDSLVEALRALTEAEPSVLQQMGEHGAKLVHQLHHFDSELDKLESLLMSAVQKSEILNIHEN